MRPRSALKCAADFHGPATRPAGLRRERYDGSICDIDHRGGEKCWHCWVLTGALFVLAIQQPVAGLSPKRASAMAGLALSFLSGCGESDEKRSPLRPLK